MSNQATDQNPKQANWVKRIVISLIIFAPPLALLQWYIIVEYRGARELDRVVAELDKSDPGWRMDLILADREEIPDTQNSALTITHIAGSDRGHRGILPSGIPSRELLDLLEKVSANERIPDKVIAQLKAELAGTESAVELARALVKFPKGRFPLEIEDNPFQTVLPYQHRTHNVANLLRMDAIRLAHQGKIDEALGPAGPP